MINANEEGRRYREFYSGHESATLSRAAVAATNRSLDVLDLEHLTEHLIAWQPSQAGVQIVLTGQLKLILLNLAK